MAGEKEVKLLGIVGSPFVSRAEIALKLKGVEYEYVHETLNKKSDLLLKYNPVHKLVPVLVHNEKAVCESLVIIEYIDETWNKAHHHPFLPCDPHHKALARFWAKFIDDKVMPAVFKAAWNPNEKDRAKGVEESLDTLEILEKELKGKFFNGDSVGIVDIAGLFVAYWLPIVQEAGDLDWFKGKFPKLDKWSHEIVNHPIIKLALPPRENLLAYAKTQFQSISSSK